MHEKMIIACGSVGAVGGGVAKLLGGWDNSIQTLLVFMAIDFAFGLACALFFQSSDKSPNGGLSSKACRNGIIKKCGTLLIVVCANYADVLLTTDYIRNAVVIAFCAAELISICENAALMGILPESVQRIFNKVIDVLKDKGEKK